MKHIKALLLVLLACLFFIIPVSIHAAVTNDIIAPIILFNATAIDASGNSTSAAINLKDYMPNGNFSVQVTSAGAFQC